MRFTFAMLTPADRRTCGWAARISAAVPQAEVAVCTTRQSTLAVLRKGAQAAYGRLDPELLEAASDLRWLACPAAGPSPDYYFPELVASPVVVTNMRGVYSDHISAHIMAFVLAFARGFHRLLPRQFKGEWADEPTLQQVVHLPEATALIVGVGGIGAATARHCKHFGMRVIGVDPRCPAPPEGVDELYRPEELDDHLGEADFVVVTVPQTPQTQGMFDRERLSKMKESGVLINVGRGSTVRLDDLNAALREGRIGGAALDVFEEEPLPPDHPLWRAPNFLMTPHCASVGPYVRERQLAILVENCRRFAEGRELINVVDKANWF